VPPTIAAAVVNSLPASAAHSPLPTCASSTQHTSRRCRLRGKTQTAFAEHISVPVVDTNSKATPDTPSCKKRRLWDPEAKSTQKERDFKRSKDADTTKPVKHTMQKLGGSMAAQDLGQQVAVIGDGWGSGAGGYAAVITDADEYTYTVISTGGANPWQETHVLKDQCIIVRDDLCTKVPKKSFEHQKRGTLAPCVHITPKRPRGKAMNGSAANC